MPNQELGKKKQLGFLSIAISRVIRYNGMVTLVLSIYNAYLLGGFDKFKLWHVLIATPVLFFLGRFFMRFEVHGLWRAEREADYASGPVKKEIDSIKQELAEIRELLR